MHLLRNGGLAFAGLVKGKTIGLTPGADHVNGRLAQRFAGANISPHRLALQLLNGLVR
jgi:hypothetical protein